jgi:acylphosphatase
MTKLFMSKKQIIKIDEFLQNYYGISYNRNNKLTHHEMNLFLSEKGKRIPKKAIFKNIQKESILNGSVIAVKDQEGQILIYVNPIRENLEDLLNELKKDSVKEKLKEVKKQIISETEKVEEDEYELKGNRYQKFIIRNHHAIRKIHY